MLFWKPLWNFSFFTLTMEIPDKNKTQPPGYHKIVLTRSTGNSKAKSKDPWKFGAIIALSSPPLGFRATVKLSEAFLHDESSITKGGYESAIVLEIPLYFFLITLGNSTLILINPWKFHMLFFWYPWKFHWYPRLNPPCLNFFWNSPIQEHINNKSLTA